MRFANPENFNSPFGGKTVVLGGDFRQILPVIPKGNRQDIVNATINSSYIWDYCTVLRLNKNMRIQNACSNDESSELEEFGQWIASIGDGIIGGANDGEAMIDLPTDILLEYSDDPIAAIVNHVYGSKIDGMDSVSYLQDRAILAPTLAVVETINQYMVSLNESEGRSYLSSDSTCTSDSNGSILSDIHTPEFLNTLKCSGVPNHNLFLKVGTPVMLLRNIDHAMDCAMVLDWSLQNLAVMCWKQKCLQVIIKGITKIVFDSIRSKIAFQVSKKTISADSFIAMTINKSQGQSLKQVGLFLKNPVFSHRRLYVAVSRATCRRGLKI